eukprot:gene32628-17641_t
MWHLSLFVSLLGLALSSSLAELARAIPLFSYQQFAIPHFGTPSSALPSHAYDCDTCRVATQISGEFFDEQAAPSLIADALQHSLCSEIECPQLKKECNSVWPVFSSLFAKWYRRTASPASLCSHQDVCGQSLMQYKHLARPSLFNLGDETTQCTMCKYVVGQAQQYLNNSGVIDDLFNKALLVCGDLPADFKPPCVDFIESYAPVIKNFINATQPEKVCELLGPCLPEAPGLWTQPPPPLPPTLVKALGSLRKATQPTAGSATNDVCDACQMAVLEAHSLIINPTFQGEVVMYTKQLCDTMGPGASDICKTTVDAYAPLLFNLTSKYCAPGVLCPALGLCPKAMQQQQASLLRQKVHMMKAGVDETGGQTRRQLWLGSGSSSESSWGISKSLLEEWASGPEQEPKLRLQQQHASLLRLKVHMMNASVDETGGQTGGQLWLGSRSSSESSWGISKSLMEERASEPEAEPTI